MREELKDPALTKHAGRFVWLELNFDKPVNRSFIVGHAVTATPTLFVLAPTSDRVIATHSGSLPLPQLTQFLERGEQGVRPRAASSEDAALARGDEQLGTGRVAEAAASYRAALRAAPATWRGRGHALIQLTTALRTLRDDEGSATTAATHAPHMAHDGDFARVVLDGLDSANRGDTARWARATRGALVRLAAQAVDLRDLDHDTRFQLYSSLVEAAERAPDHPARQRWQERWLRELDAIHPKSDDERTALDIARVEAARTLELPGRFVPALEASERAMPGNYVPSLRLAQLLLMSKRWDAMIGACNRGLARVDGPLGRSWLLMMKAQALLEKGDRARARQTLIEARQSASQINSPANRESYFKSIDALQARERHRAG